MKCVLVTPTTTKQLTTQQTHVIANAIVHATVTAIVALKNVVS